MADTYGRPFVSGAHHDLHILKVQGTHILGLFDYYLIIYVPRSYGVSISLMCGHVSDHLANIHTLALCLKLEISVLF